MFVFKQVETGTWTVGHYDGKKKWVPESDHDFKGEAVNRVHFLNGGNLVPLDMILAGRSPKMRS